MTYTREKTLWEIWFRSSKLGPEFASIERRLFSVQSLHYSIDKTFHQPLPAERFRTFICGTSKGRKEGHFPRSCFGNFGMSHMKPNVMPAGPFRSLVH
jgi:hypothetical protein